PAFNACKCPCMVGENNTKLTVPFFAINPPNTASGILASFAKFARAERATVATNRAPCDAPGGMRGNDTTEVPNRNNARAPVERFALPIAYDWEIIPTLFGIAHDFKRNP